MVEGFTDVAVTNEVSPAVASVEITSDPGLGGLYAFGEPIDVTATFTTSVDVDTASGTPRIKLGLGGLTGQKWADYHSGSGTDTLVFRYTPAAGDSSRA